MTGRERDFADAARVIDDSVIMRVITGGASFVGRAFQARHVATLKGSPHLGLIVVVGVLTHALVLQVMPARIAPVRPMAYQMAVAFSAFAIAAGFITKRSDNTASADSAAGTAKTRNS